jgi:hypothetical protein
MHVIIGMMGQDFPPKQYFDHCNHLKLDFDGVLLGG